MGWASRQLEVQRSEVAAGKRKSVDVGLANQAVQEDREAARADEHHRAAVARANEDQLTLQRESLAQDERHALETLLWELATGIQPPFLPLRITRSNGAEGDS